MDRTWRISGLGGSGALARRMGVSKLSASGVPYLCPYRRECVFADRPVASGGGSRAGGPTAALGLGGRPDGFLGQWERAQRAGAPRGLQEPRAMTSCAPCVGAHPRALWDPGRAEPSVKGWANKLESIGRRL